MAVIAAGLAAGLRPEELGQLLGVQTNTNELVGLLVRGVARLPARGNL